MTTAALPTADRDRLVALDVLRGVAVLGIFAMNVQSFAMPEAALLDPRAYGDLTGANYFVWLVAHVFAAGKFITIFSILFGVGIALRDRDDAGAGRRFARRQICLLAIGLVHAFVFWHGDVLVSYALVGCLVYPFRRARPGALILAGAIAYALGAFVMAGMSALALTAPGDLAAVADPNAIAAELAAFRGPWAEQFAFRARLVVESQLYLLPFYSLPMTTGLMLAGVGLSRLSFFAGAWRGRTYAAIAIVGGAIGLSLVALELQLGARSGHDPLRVAYLYAHLNTLAAPGLASAYAAIVMLVAPRWRLAPLAAVGRTALSCYLLETVIGTTLFYGHGFGLFGRVERVGQMGVTIAVWIALLIVAPLWLKHYRFGPVEWVWRSVTYARPQPMRRVPG